MGESEERIRGGAWLTGGRVAESARDEWARGGASFPSAGKGAVFSLSPLRCVLIPFCGRNGIACDGDGRRVYKSSG